MAYLKRLDFIQLKAFFLALQQSHFNLSQVSSRVILDKIPTPIDKLHCLALLRSFPDLQGEKFKDDNALIKHLSQPGNIQRILGQLPIDQQLELTKALMEKPAAAGVTNEQPGGQEAPAGQVVGEPVSTMAGGGPQMPSLPSSSYTRSTPTRILNKAPAATAEKITSFTDADQTAAVEEAQRIVTTKTPIPEVLQKPSIPAPIVYSAKNFSSAAQIFTKKNLGKIGGGLGDMVKGAGRGIGSPMLNGVSSGLGKVWNGGLRNFPNIARPRISSASFSKGIGLRGKVAAAFLLLGFFFGISVFSALSQSPTTSEASPVSANLASCQFTRAGNSLPIKSSILQGWINQTASTIGIPPQILASVAMHENPNFVTTSINTDDAIQNNQFCNKGKPFCEDGHGHVLHDDPCTPSEITQGNRIATAIGLMQLLDIYNPGKDLCSITENLAVAAEKLKADGISSQPTQDQVTSAIKAYYSSCNYGSFSYCNEVWQDLQNCKSTSFAGVIAPPADPDPSVLAINILNKFGVAMDVNFDYSYLKWTWEKLWQISDTNFLTLVRGPNNTAISVLRNTAAINEQYSCNSIGIRGTSSATGKPYPEALFKYVFLHELSHIIDSCNPAKSAKSGLQAVINQEGYITNFSQNSATCPGSAGDIPVNEDYADTISYFLNPDIPEQSLGIGSACEPTSSINPYAKGRILHQQFAQDLLSPRSTSLTTLPQFSCPVVGGGRNVLPSFQFQPDGASYGHCGTLYNTKEGFSCTDGTASRRAKSVDIESCLNPRPSCSITTCEPLTSDEWDNVYKCGEAGKDLQLPTLNGEIVQWQYLGEIKLNGEMRDCFDYEMRGGTPNSNATGNGCGVGYMFKTNYQGHSWTLHLLHLHGTTLALNTLYPSGTPLGKTQAVHTHISVGEDITKPDSQNESGWIPADLNLNICNSQTNLGYK